MRLPYLEYGNENVGLVLRTIGDTLVSINNPAVLAARETDVVHPDQAIAVSGGYDKLLHPTRQVFYRADLIEIYACGLEIASPRPRLGYTDQAPVLAPLDCFSEAGP